jgi:hypothetical protein
LTIDEVEEKEISDVKSKRLGEILVQYRNVPPEEVNKALPRRKDSARSS